MTHKVGSSAEIYSGDERVPLILNLICLQTLMECVCVLNDVWNECFVCDTIESSVKMLLTLTTYISPPFAF